MAWAKEIYVATTGCGVYYTDDFIQPEIQPTWQRINNGLLNLKCKEFHLDPFHQSERQYVLTGDSNHVSHEGLYSRFMGEEWELLLDHEGFAAIFTTEALDSIKTKGFCIDNAIDGRLWIVGQLHYVEQRYYGPFGWGPYGEDRVAYSDDYGETWHGCPTWWSGWSYGIPSSLRTYGDIVYIRDEGGMGSRCYIEYSYDRGNTWYYTGTDILGWTNGGFLNPHTPNRFYYDTRPLYNEFRFWESGILSPPMIGFWLGDSRWDTLWYNEEEPSHMRLINQNKIWTTYDAWDTYPIASDEIETPYGKISLSPYAGDNSDYMILGLYHDDPVRSPSIGTLYGEGNTDLKHIAGENWNIPPYENSICQKAAPCRCGVQGVNKRKGYIYVNAVGMPDYEDITPGNSGKGVPMQGDRSAWNARYYKKTHASDINSGSTTSIHHTLSTHFVNKTTGSYKEAPGDHSHYLRDMDSGSSISGEILTSVGTGSPVWHTLPDHYHAGSAIGDGGRFNADHLSSESQPINFSLTYYGGNVVWKPINGWRLSIVENTNMDSSDKEFVVPPDTELQILWAWIEFTSTATSGSRQVEIQLTDSSNNIIGKWQAGATQSENSTCKYLFGMVVPDLTSFRDSNYLMTPIPSSTFLSVGQKIRIWDNKSIDYLADDMIVRLQYSYHTV